MVSMMSRVVAIAILACASAAADPKARFIETREKLADGPALELPGGLRVMARADSQPKAACDLRLYAEQAPGEGVYGVDTGHLGVALVESRDKGYVDGVCIKRAGEALELPAAMLVASADAGAVTRFCKDTAKPGRIASAKAGDSTPVSVCTWDGTFHSSRPFTFVLVSTAGKAVADFVEFARVYRNGDLMAAWNRSSDQPDLQRISLGGDSLRSGFWAATLPPHRAAMDLRIIPRGTPGPDAVDLLVRDDRDRFRRRIKQALQAGFDEALPKDSPARVSLDCLKNAVVHAKDQVLMTVRGQSGVPQLDPNCVMPLGLSAGTPLSDWYTQTKDLTRDRLVELKNDAEEEIEKARGALERTLPAAAKKALDEGAKRLLDHANDNVQAAVARALASQPGSSLVQFLERERVTLGLAPTDVVDLQALYESFGKLVVDVDRQVAFALRSVDEARALALELFEEARGIATNSERQASIFNAVAENLRDQGSVFEARRDNPALLLGEQRITMEYSDPWQTFFLSPWNGVPIRLSDAEADLNAAVAIPLVDFFGVRLQWGKSRFAEARLALGGGFTSTKRIREDGSSVDKAAFLPNLSFGLGTARIAVGLVTVDAGSKFHDQLRFIVGADLLKLATGSNVEAF